MKIGNIILWWLMHQTSHWQSCESERSCAPREGSHSSHSQNASSGSVEIKRCCVLVEESSILHCKSDWLEMDATMVLGENLNQLTTSENDDDADSDASENSDEIDKDFFGTRNTAASPPHSRQSNSPTSRAGSPNSSSTGVKRRMSMARPVVHHNLPGLVLDEKENSAFLNDLTFMIAEFPVPPSHAHSIEPHTNNLTNFGIISLAGSWFRSKNDGP
jgi:hypothetical protein